MKRWEFIFLLGGAVVAWSFATVAQVSVRRPLVAILVAGSSTNISRRVLSGFSEGMQELGYVEGRDIDIVYRYADDDLARMPTLANELIQLMPSVFVTSTVAGTLAIRQATASIPIVNPALTDPVGFGFVASQARPGGQVTGILISSDNLAAKQMELALEILPGAKKIGMLMHAGNQSNMVHQRNLEAATGALALKLVTGEAHGPSDLDAAFQTLAGEHVELVVVPPDGLFVSERRKIVTLAAAARLPVLYPYREFVEAGGLLSYGVDLRDSWRRAATFVDKILKGAKPADLPIEQPTNELVVNVKTAKALGLDIPATALARANQVIQ
jgi:ABC-type uncharacterized transport system substrate-binding protein